MRDSYINMFKEYDNIWNRLFKPAEKIFINWAMKEIKALLPKETNDVTEEWNSLLHKIDKNKLNIEIQKLNKCINNLTTQINKKNRTIVQYVNMWQTTYNKIANYKNNNTTGNKINILQTFLKKQPYAKGISKLKKILKDLGKLQELETRLKKENNKLSELRKKAAAKIYIRGYSQNKTNSLIPIQNLYKKASFSCHGNIEIDKNNNAQPPKLLTHITNYTKDPEEAKKSTKELIQNYKVSHIWGFTKNIYLFNCPWNIIYTPSTIDPLTGHESAEGKLKNELKRKVYELILSKYSKFIEEYNEVILNNTKVKNLKTLCLNRAIKACLIMKKYKNRHNSLLKKCEGIENFYENMLEQWQPLTQDNIFASKNKEIHQAIESLTDNTFHSRPSIDDVKTWLRFSNNKADPDWLCNIVTAETCKLLY